MENPEKAIERVLEGLRDAEAPVGMERRIVEGVRDRVAAGAGHGWLRWRPIWLETRRLAWSAGTVAVLVAVAMLYTMRRAPDLPQRRVVVVVPAVGSKVAVANGGSVLPTERPVSRVRRASVRVVDGGNSIALGAANHPAPPMPLTEQERLLLWIVHKGDPVEMAMLDPMQRAARNVEEEAEFQRFFGEATSGRPAAGEAKTEQSAGGPSTTGQPATEQPTTEQPPAEQPTTEQPPAEQPTTEQPPAEQPTTEQPTTEQPTTEQSPTGDKQKDGNDNSRSLRDDKQKDRQQQSNGR
jgi:hypothetical protein